MKKLIITLIGILFTTQVYAIGFQADWNKNTEPDLAGYKVCYGTASGVYTTTLDVGLFNSVQVDALVPNVTYFVCVKAYDTSGNVSACSAEVSIKLVPPDITPPAPPTGVKLSIWQKIVQLFQRIFAQLRLTQRG